MNKKIVTGLIASALLLIGAATAVMALPPPVPQSLGIYDAKFTSFTRNECLVCHISDAVLVPRHHNLINTKGLACLDCHTMVPDGTGGFTFADFRTCSNCHKASPHHTTAKAAAQDCKFCHGSFIDNPLDGHYIPTYGVSSITPMKNGRQVTDPSGNIVTVQGCVACHQPNAAAIDPTTNLPRAISSNADTHHGTGIGAVATATTPAGIGKCEWCHNFNNPGLEIRQCESCHGVKSLHNIQLKSATGTVTPGSELAGFGHIGNNWDCQGCHWSWYGNAATNPATAIVPSLQGQSAYTLAANKAASLTLTGASFTNVGGDSVTYNPSVTISNDTFSATLTPASFTDSEIQVNVPALLEGTYNLTVIKEGVKSNLAKLVVFPELAIKTAVMASKNTVTITGSGFGMVPPADYNSGMGVFADTTQARILSWSPTKIVASSRAFATGAEVTVKALNGSVSKIVLAVAKKTR
ncbi:MAG: hypothetical protein GJV46_10615 [Geobacter sp.]|nr:hypothetical protein [Geobacter sp.]